MDSKLAHWCNGLMEAGWLAAVIAVPLFFNIHSDRVFEPDKLTLLRSIALLMAVAWLARFVSEQGWEDLSWLRWREAGSIWRQPLVLPVFLLVLVYVASTLFSVTPQVSWAGSYQRLQGTYTTFSYIVVFALMASTIRTRDQVQRVVTAVIITSIPISFYGMLQHFDLDPLPWGGNTQSRIAGHMGNAIFIAAYLIMVVPPTLARIIDAFTNILNDEELSYADVIRSSIYIFALAIQLLGIYWSGSRGPWIGLAVGLFAFVLVLLVSLRETAAAGQRLRPADLGRMLLLLLGGTFGSFAVISFLIGRLVAAGRAPSLAGPLSSFVSFAAALGLVTGVIFLMIAARRGWRWLWLSWLSLAVLVALWLGAFNFAEPLDTRFGEAPVLGDVTETLVEWKSLPAIGRLGRLLDSDVRTGRVRILIWEGALRLIGIHEPLTYPDGNVDRYNFLRPLIGYGPESMYVAYNRFYPPELATVEARNASPDRSHNETFDALVITGGLGFLVWQVLYVSVFYYGFKWLGVVRSRRDRNLLVLLWVGGAAVTTLIITQTMGMPFLGVAIPFGSIIGLVIYLIYYALFLPHGSDDEADHDPFHPDRLLMIALVTAVLAHFVEIHFGIAIAATRLHFFVYVGLMLVVGHLLPRLQAAPAVVPTRRRGRRRVSRGSNLPAARDVWGPVLIHGFMLALMLGILGFEFMTYSLPPDRQIASAADITAGEIFHQSLFVNPRQDFADSPFVFLMLMLTWVLGALLSLSEMAKRGQLAIGEAAAPLRPDRERLTGLIFVLAALLGLGAAVYFYFVNPPQSVTGTIGRSLALLWGITAGYAAVAQFTRRPRARLWGVAVALTGLAFSLPLLVTGATAAGLLLGVVGLALVLLQWDSRWGDSLAPAATMTMLALAVGLIYAFVQASMVRNSIAPQVTTPFATLQEQRVFEAMLATSFLTLFYIFVIVLLLAGAFLLARHTGARTREFGGWLPLATLVLLLVVALVAVSRSNVRIIQADVVFKRGKPFDQQASRLGRDPASQQEAVAAWDNTIAIYEQALDLAPQEDFYYLFLGRAYLERSTIEPDPVQQQALFEQAEARLLLAQRINPLNTDHTANLARLNTRLTQLAQSQPERQARLEEAESYYEKALALSPQNSIIRNEYAALTLDLKQDCEGGLAIYDASVAVDPFYAFSFFARADAYAACATQQPEAARLDYYETAVVSLQDGLALEPENSRAWLQLGQLSEQLGDYATAAEALQNALANDQAGQLPAWSVNLQTALAYRELADTERAIAAGQLALRQAPPNGVDQVRQLLLDLGVAEADLAVPAATDTGAIPLEGDRPLAGVDPLARNGIYSAPPPFTLDTSQQYEALIRTEKGDMRVRLFDDEAPVTVNNFIFLAEQGFYDNTTFHRVLDDFMAQGGDPTGTGAGGPGYQFADETDNGLTFSRPGLLAMANAGPNTNGSQFFITFAPTPWLDGNHTIFGEVVAGQEVLDRLTRRDPEANPDFPGDRVEAIEILVNAGGGG